MINMEAIELRAKIYEDIRSRGSSAARLAAIQERAAEVRVIKAGQWRYCRHRLVRGWVQPQLWICTECRHHIAADLLDGIEVAS